MLSAESRIMKTSGSLAVLLSLIIPLSASRAQRALQPADITQLRAAVSASISPGGDQVAYILNVPRKPLEDPDGPAWNHLYVVDLAGNNRPFITGQESIGPPQWMPDGRSIVYAAKRGDDKETCLYRIPVDGGESRKLLEHETSISGFDLSPDGKQVAFLATEQKDEREKKLEDDGFNQEVFEEDWRYTRVWIREIDDAEVDTEARMLDIAGSASLVRWSHAGTELAVVLAPTPSVDDSYMAKQIHVVDAETGRIKAKVEHIAKLGDVQWSPDDKRVAFIGGADVHDPSDGRLMVAEVSQSAQPRDLMPDYEAHVSSLQWLDSNSLIWTADEGTLTRVGSVDLEGQVETLLEPDADAGIYGSLSISDNREKGSLLAHARVHFLEVFSMDIAAGEVKRLTSSNDWLEEIEFARQETVTWEATDGLDLQGVLIYPLDYQPEQRYPMIMLVHGGPEAHVSDGWVTTYSQPGQMGAGRGFFVFYPNYRGSTGRGVQFSRLGQADAAGKEFSDLIDAIDFLAEEGLVDKDKVGITGGSYGGYASAWATTFYSDRYAASVMFVGISDNVSKVGTTDIPEEMFLVHHRKRLWDDWDYFLRTSPIRYVERNRTPTLILHGKEDPRVHPSQSLELHRHLKTLGQAPVRLVLYKGEGHGNRKAASRLDYTLRLIRWMEHYLKGPGGEPPEMQLDYRAALGISDD
jgi:dipeptidyl aminopeptidase/acylaminoacyl peptidase